MDVGITGPEFKIIMIDILRALIEKVDNMPEQIGNVRRTW